MKVNILDPTLIGFAGHHFDRSRSVSASLTAGGNDVHIYGNTGMTLEVRSALSLTAEVSATFRSNPYFPPLGSGPLRSMASYFISSDQTALDLEGIRKADVWIWHSLFADQLRASALVRPDAVISGVIHMPPRGAVQRLIWRHAFRSARSASLALGTVGTIEPNLTRAFAPLAGRTHLETLPLPHSVSSPLSVPKTLLKTVGFFGYQRHEKGIAHLESLVNEFLANDFNVIVQDSGDGVRFSTKSPGLRRYGYVSELAPLMKEAEFVILPYDPGAFARKCSGIASFAIACGIPVLAPDRTAIAQVLKRYDTGLVYADLADIVPLMMKTRANYSEYADRALHAATLWAGENGIEKHSRALTGEKI